MHLIFWGHFFLGGIFFCVEIFLGEKFIFWERKEDFEGRKEDLERSLKANLEDLLFLL